LGHVRGVSQRVFVGTKTSSIERDLVMDFGDGDRLQFSAGLSVTTAVAANLAGAPGIADTLLTLSSGSSIVLVDFDVASWRGGAGWII
jgi:hypothetical protein